MGDKHKPKLESDGRGTTKDLAIEVDIDNALAKMQLFIGNPSVLDLIGLDWIGLD